MSEIKHHLTDSLLMAYASGNLSEGFSLVVATHISLCDECRARMQGFEAVGGALIDDEETAPMQAGSLDATLALIERGLGADEAPIRTSSGAVFPAPLQGYVGGDQGLAGVPPGRRAFRLHPACGRREAGDP